MMVNAQRGKNLSDLPSIIKTETERIRVEDSILASHENSARRPGKEFVPRPSGLIISGGCPAPVFDKESASISANAASNEQKETEEEQNKTKQMYKPTNEASGVLEGGGIQQGIMPHFPDDDGVPQADGTRAEFPSLCSVVDPTLNLVSSSLAPVPSPVSPQSTASVGFSPPERSNSKDQNKRGVPHVYHDYSNVPDMVGYVRKKTGGVTNPFPEKLHELLSKETGSHARSIISWLPHGRAFIVLQPKEFTKEIMPRYFRQTKLTSFQRQLNLYGFRRITQGADAGAYYHELFLRGRSQLCMRMVRQKVKGTGHKQPADVQTEPNFYALPPQPLTEEASWKKPTLGAEVGTMGAAASDDNITTPTSPTIDMSPGIHGAAKLLKGIATLPASSLSNTAFLGPPATAESSATTSTSQKPQQSLSRSNPATMSSVYQPAAGSNSLKFESSITAGDPLLQTSHHGGSTTETSVYQPTVRSSSLQQDPSTSDNNSLSQIPQYDTPITLNLVCQQDKGSGSSQQGSSATSATPMAANSVYQHVTRPYLLHQKPSTAAAAAAAVAVAATAAATPLSLTPHHSSLHYRQATSPPQSTAPTEETYYSTAASSHQPVAFLWPQATSAPASAQKASCSTSNEKVAGKEKRITEQGGSQNRNESEPWSLQTQSSESLSQNANSTEKLKKGED